MNGRALIVSANRLLQSCWLFLLLAQTACFAESPRSEMGGAIGRTTQPAALSILALGDSYTIGTSVRAAQRWPNLLQQQLIASGINAENPEIVARNGWTTANLLAGMRSAKKNDRYDWVMLMIGVNNQFQRRPLDEFRLQLAELIERSIALAGDKPSRVIVLSIPDWGVSGFGQSAGPERIAADIARFNLVVKELAGEASAIFVNLDFLVENARDDSSYLANDRLHFSGKMHALWAEKVSIVIANSD